MFGCGGILSDESIRFVTSTATTDYLYYAEDEGQLWSKLDGSLLCFCVNKPAVRYARSIGSLKGVAGAVQKGDRLALWKK